MPGRGIVDRCVVGGGVRDRVGGRVIGDVGTLLAGLVVVSCLACGGDSTSTPGAPQGTRATAEPTTSVGAQASGEPAASAQADAAPNRRRIRVHPTLPEYTLTVIGVAIEIRRADAPAPVQVIDGLDAIAGAGDAPEPDVLDMNFDGYADFRLVDGHPAGPNVPYRNWLFDPAAGRFVESQALNAITSPQFDPAAREVRSEWRDGPTRYGTDVYAYGANGLTAIRKEVRTYSEPGRYATDILRQVDGVWKVVERRAVRAP